MKVGNFQISKSEISDFKSEKKRPAYYLVAHTKKLCRVGKTNVVPSYLSLEPSWDDDAGLRFTHEPDFNTDTQNQIYLELQV